MSESQKQVLGDAEIKWIEDTAGAIPKMDATVNLDRMKQKMLNDARNVIEGSVGQIKLGNDFKIEMLTDFFKFKYDMDTIGGDPNEEFDVGHDLQNVGKVDPQQIKLLTEAQAIVFKETEKLRKATDEATRKPLFTDREISDAIWEPLKRRKLIPEASIPDRYSEVSRQFEGAAAGYETRLEAYNESLGDENKWGERLGVAKEIFDTGGSLVKGIIGDLTALKVDLGMKPEQVGDILKGVTVGVSTLLDTAKTLVEADGINLDVVEQVVKNAITIAQSEITAALTTKSDSQKALGDAISTGIGIAVNGVSIAKKLAAAEKGKWASVLADLAGEVGEVIEGCLGVYASQLDFKEKKKSEESGSDSSDDSPGERFKGIGEEVKKAMAYVAGAAPLGDGLTKENLSKALVGMMKAGIDTTVGEIGKAVGKDFDGSDVKDQLQAIADSMTALRAAKPDEREEMVKKDPKIKKLLELIEKEEKAALEGNDPQQWQEDLAEDTRKFRDMLNRSETGESEEDLETVEELMLTIKKDQMMVNLAFQLASMGPQAVAIFLPQAGIAVSAIALVQNFSKAIEHYLAFQEWKENAQDSKSAMSFQMEAMLNRKNNSRDQTADAVVKTLTKAIEIVAQSMSLAGPFAPAGQVVASTLSGAVAIKELILKYVAKRDLEKAYRLFLDAREKPGDRKLLREAVRKNATLAKYVIAYGALVENDPVSKRAMQKCGLTQEMLTNKNTNAQNAVSYLETLYPEDPVVLVRAEKPLAWHPGPVIFSALSFSAFAGAAEQKANPKMLAGACRSAVALFTRWQKLDAEFNLAREGWDRARKAAEVDNPAQTLVDAEIEALKALQVKLDLVEKTALELVRQLPVVRPAGVDGKPHAEMAAYLRTLVSLGLGFTKSYRRAAEALERQEGAMARDTATGQLAV